MKQSRTAHKTQFIIQNFVEVVSVQNNIFDFSKFILHFIF